MKDGLEEFLKRIEAKPTNETLIDRFMTLVLEEEVLERILYLKKLVGLLLTPNPYAALKAAALELQEARKEKLTREYEVGALKDVESCFLKLDKMENAQLVRDEINKLHTDMVRENTSTRGRTPPPHVPKEESKAETAQDVPLPARQARVHFRLPSSDLEDDDDYERTARHQSSQSDSVPPSPPRAAQRSIPPTMPEPYAAPKAPVEGVYQDAFAYSLRQKNLVPDVAGSLADHKEFYDKNLEETDERPDAATRPSSLSQVSGLNVGPNLLENPEVPAPQRHRNIQSVFETTEGFSKKQGASPEDEPAPKSEKSAKPWTDAASKSGFRSALDPAENVPDSNSMFQESQHVHFPEMNFNRSMSKQEARKAFGGDITGSLDAALPVENTDRLTDSNLENAAIPFDSEATRQLDAAELARAVMPVEPAFPPNEFDMPPFDFASQNELKPHPPSKNKAIDPFAGLRDQMRMESEFSQSRHEPEVKPNPARDLFARVSVQVDPVTFMKDAAPSPSPRHPFAGRREPSTAKDSMYFPKDSLPPKAASASGPGDGAAPHKGAALSAEPRWNLLRDRLRLLSGIQISRSHTSDFVLRLLGENSSRTEQQEMLSILLQVLEGPRQPRADQRFLAFLFEELQPKALHQLLGALKIGDQAVVFFADYLQSLLKESQLRRVLNVIHVVIIPGLDLSWYQESYRFLMLIWPELGLKGWHWLEEEGPMAFCDRLAAREDLLPATLLA